MLAVILVSDFCNVNSQRIYTAADFPQPQPKHWTPFSPSITWARGSNSLRVTWYRWALCVLYSLRGQELVKVEVAVLGSPSQMYCLYGLCGRQATLNLTCQRSGACESGGGHPGLPVPNVLSVWSLWTSSNTELDLSEVRSL